jgi:hypothetical protein
LYLRYRKGMSETPETANPSHDLDMESVLQSVGAEAEMEALAVHSLLNAAGIPAILVGSSSLPNLPFEVQVPHDHVDEARRRIAEAKAAGPAAAEEAERATEAGA